MKLASLVLATFVVGVPSQGLVTVPDGYLSAEGDSRTTVPGIGRSGVKQWLIGSSHLTPLRGRSVAGLVFRHDANWDETTVPGSATLVVRIGPAAVEPLDATTDFAANLLPTHAVEVFRGSAAFGVSSVTAGAATWNAPHVLELPFTTPFAYAGGPIAIEIDGMHAASAATWWSVDGVEEQIAGTVTDIGTSCGARDFPNGRTALVDPASLVLGGSAEFHFYGQANASALLLIGATTFPTPINLALLGAPGCELHVSPFAAIARPLVDSNIQGLGSVARALVSLPAQTDLLGGELYAQWFEVGATFTTSQAIRFQIAPRLPTLDLATLIRREDGSVELHPSFAPVFGFRML